LLRVLEPIRVQRRVLISFRIVFGVNKEFHEGGKVRERLGIKRPRIELYLGLTEKLNDFQSVNVGA